MVTITFSIMVLHLVVLLHTNATQSWKKKKNKNYTPIKLLLEHEHHTMCECVSVWVFVIQVYSLTYSYQSLALFLSLFVCLFACMNAWMHMRVIFASVCLLASIRNQLYTFIAVFTTLRYVSKCRYYACSSFFSYYSCFSNDFSSSFVCVYLSCLPLGCACILCRAQNLFNLE